MLDDVAIEGIKVGVKLEEMKNFLDKIIDKAGEQLCMDAEHMSVRNMAAQAREYGNVVKECYRIKDILDAITNNLDAPIEQLYKYIFRNDPVALNLEKIS